MDVYSTAFCLPRPSLARLAMPPPGSPLDTTTAQAANPSPIVPAAPPPAAPGPPIARRHVHSLSQSSISPSSLMSARSTDLSSSSTSRSHLSRPASLASLAEHAANDLPPASSGARVTTSPVSLKSAKSPTSAADLGPPGTRRSTGSGGITLPSEPPSAASSTSTHRTSASLGSNVLSSLTSSTSSSTGASSNSSNATASGGAGSKHAHPPPAAGKSQAHELADAMQKLAQEAMTQHQVLVNLTPTPVAFRQTSHSPSSSLSSPVISRSSLLVADESFSSATADGPVNTMMPLPAGRGFNVHLSGSYQQVMAARGFLQREAPFMRKSIVKVPRAEVLDAAEAIKTEMRRKLDDIAGLTKAHLAIVGQASGSTSFGLETDRSVDIVITGAYDSVEQARVRLLVLLDELSGLHSEVCEIDYKLHNIIAGRKRGVLQTIQEETGTNLYLPSPFSGLFGSKSPHAAIKQNLIFITGEFFGVQRARDMLFQVSIHKSKCIISRDTAILPRKLDWMLTERLEDIKHTMVDNGTYVHLPMIGSVASLITVYGDHRVNIERTLRSIMHLSCQFYVASVWLLPATFDVFMPPPSINTAAMPVVTQKISAATGAEVVFKSNCFELHGLEDEVRQAVQMVADLEAVKPFQLEVRFQLELANEHREFISGKKNGKLNKIMKTANVKIKFETFNDYNFLIDVAGNQAGALEGLSMLQEELPAEISFHIPELYHKRIIGVGGKNIQRIMKKYGVYVKFSNAEEFAALGGYADNEDNVVARTPSKNAESLDQLKMAVMEMVTPRDKDFVNELVSVPRRYHRVLLGEKSIFLHDIEHKTNCVFRFPGKETASDVVTIFGPESQIHMAAQMLLVHIPFEAELKLPHSSDMAQLVLGPEFMSLLDRVRNDFNISILPWVDRSGNAEDSLLRFCLNRSNVDYLGTAWDMLYNFLTAKKIPLYPGTHRSRSESRIDPFQHFNSALLSTSTRSLPRHDQKVLLTSGETPSLQREREATPSTFTDPLAAVSASPMKASDIRHLFEVSPPYIPSSYSAFGSPFTAASPANAYMPSRSMPYGMAHSAFAIPSPPPHAAAAAAQHFGYLNQFHQQDTDTLANRLSHVNF